MDEIGARQLHALLGVPEVAGLLEDARRQYFHPDPVVLAKKLDVRPLRDRRRGTQKIAGQFRVSRGADPVLAALQELFDRDVEAFQAELHAPGMPPERANQASDAFFQIERDIFSPSKSPTAVDFCAGAVLKGEHNPPGGAGTMEAAL